MDQPEVLDGEQRADSPERTVPLAPPVASAVGDGRDAEPRVAPAGTDGSAVTPLGVSGVAEGNPRLASRHHRPRLPRLLGRRKAATERRRSLVAAARVPLLAPVRVVVAAPKGGVGKTTVAL